jgi:hypothetical protein
MGNFRERIPDQEEALLTFVEGVLAGVWTAIPAIIQSFDREKMTVVAQPTIQGIRMDKDGTKYFVKLPECLDCPVQFPSGGGFSLTFPVEAGDECLLVFSSRCIDSWWQNGGVQPPAEFRRHNLSDGFALLGFRSVPRVIADISQNAAQLRSDGGDVFVEVTEDTAKVSAPNVKVHGGTTYAWDCHGYGEKWTWTGGSTWQRDTYFTGAVVTTVSHNINPPEIPA